MCSPDGRQSAGTYKCSTGRKHGLLKPTGTPTSVGRLPSCQLQAVMCAVRVETSSGNVRLQGRCATWGATLRPNQRANPSTGTAAALSLQSSPMLCSLDCDLGVKFAKLNYPPCTALLSLHGSGTVQRNYRSENLF